MALAQILNQQQTRWASFVGTVKNYYTGGISAVKRALRGIGFN